MNNSRRDLLKFFGVGTIIAPVVGAAPFARLIEPPKVELFQAPKVIAPIQLGDVRHVSVTLEMADGASHSLRGPVYYWQGYADVSQRFDLRFYSMKPTSPAVWSRTGDIEVYR